LLIVIVLRIKRILSRSYTFQLGINFSISGFLYEALRRFGGRFVRGAALVELADALSKQLGNLVHIWCFFNEVDLSSFWMGFGFLSHATGGWLRSSDTYVEAD
jgi:hypothetical protein